jgi:hypothetical protein
MRGELPMKLYDVDAGMACDGPNPGASAQSRYAAIGAKGDRYEENVIRHPVHTFDCSLLVCGTTTDINSGTTYRHYCSPYSNSLAAHAGINR